MRQMPIHCIQNNRLLSSRQCGQMIFSVKGAFDLVGKVRLPQKLMLAAQSPIFFSNFFNRSNNSGSRAYKTCDLRHC
jgi:hypothetical protein